MYGLCCGSVFELKSLQQTVESSDVQIGLQTGYFLQAVKDASGYKRPIGTENDLGLFPLQGF